MALVLNEKYNNSDKTVVFYKNRFLKLFPIYWTILVLTLLVSFVSYIVLNKGGSLEYIIKNIDNLGFFNLYILFSNIFLIGEGLLMFLGFDGNSIVFAKSFSDISIPLYKFIVVPQSWTLSLEIMFYAIAPYVARKKLWLLLGMIIYRVYSKGLYFSLVKNKNIFFILVLPLVFDYTKNSKLDRNIGELSYPVYIVHLLVVSILSQLVGEDYIAILAILFSILCSLVLNKYIQKRVDKIRIKNLKG